MNPQVKKKKVFTQLMALERATVNMNLLRTLLNFGGLFRFAMKLK